MGRLARRAGRHGRRNGPLFAAGWVAGLTVVAVLVAVVFGGADDPESTSSAVADWLRVAAGAALVVLGIRTWSRRPRRRPHRLPRPRSARRRLRPRPCRPPSRCTRRRPWWRRWRPPRSRCPPRPPPRTGSLSTRADTAEKEAPGEPADAVLWEQLEGATHEESTLSITYSAFMILATMIAACGVVLDNSILIVGAMA
ncbi:GAP family protein, partial [Streptomyces massasporeus]